ncbi:MAG: hypothetical protein Q4P72_05030 [Eubacteriales bacterium]|nr:hypothetical protein [Eubacteriales bacterium]
MWIENFETNYAQLTRRPAPYLCSLVLFISLILAWIPALANFVFLIAMLCFYLESRNRLVLTAMAQQALLSFSLALLRIIVLLILGLILRSQGGGDEPWQTYWRYQLFEQVFHWINAVILTLYGFVEIYLCLHYRQLRLTIFDPFIKSLLRRKDG